MTNKLSIEVYRDTGVSSRDASPVLAGIEGLLKFTDALDIAEFPHEVRMRKNDQGEIEHAYQKDYKRADISVFVSHSPLDRTTADGDRVYGVAWAVPNEPSPLGFRVANISLHDNKNLGLVGTHEVAHTLNLKNFGRKHDRKGHCIDTCCIMYREAPKSKLEERIMNVSNRIDARLQNLREYADATNGFFSLRTFCPDCRAELVSNTDILTDVKRGIYVPREIIFPSAFSNRAS